MCFVLFKYKDCVLYWLYPKTVSLCISHDYRHVFNFLEIHLFTDIEVFNRRFRLLYTYLPDGGLWHYRSKS